MGKQLVHGFKSMNKYVPLFIHDNFGLTMGCFINQSKASSTQLFIQFVHSEAYLVVKHIG